ncbi:MAG TPA: ATP-dependent Clp protease proteolytic subunit [Candidatus Sulfotelmatobacter sp.]|nr:ATP-dependent Clp protease proteolytic subunit [Candidatus Sulfotelmatobacter sp.]HWI57640.1 ATP-dependent Clp protease proteolytic subunit [Bacillota bacterium]
MISDLNRASRGQKPTGVKLPPGRRVGVTFVSSLTGRRVPLRGALTRPATISCINRLLFLVAQDRHDPILVEINAQGGSWFESLWFIQTMDRVACPVPTFCSGPVADAAVIIAAHGQRGCRVAAPEAQFRFSPGATPENATESVRNSNARQELIGVLAQDTGKPPAEIARWLEAGATFTAQQALELGLIDLVSPKPVFPSKA